MINNINHQLLIKLFWINYIGYRYLTILLTKLHTQIFTIFTTNRREYGVLLSDTVQTR